MYIVPVSYGGSMEEKRLICRWYVRVVDVYVC